MLTKETIKTVKSTWAARREHDVHEHIVYNILREKEITLGFAKIANYFKIISNANDPMYAFNKAKSDLSMSLNKKSYLYDKAYLKDLEKTFGIDMDENLIEYILGKLK